MLWSCCVKGKNESLTLLLAPVIKAKLEVVESGISVLDEEFLAQIVLPDGSTAGDFLVPQIERVYESGDMPKMIPFIE